MVGIDLKSVINFGPKTFIDSLKGLANVRRTDGLLTIARLSTQQTIRQVRPQIRRQQSNKKFFMFRPVSLYGICTDNISPKPARYRNLSAGNAAKTLSLWNTLKHLTQHACKRKRKSRLENLCRFRTNPDKQSKKALCQRRLRYSTEPRSLCSGFNNHRFMSFTFSMGKISQTQGRCQGTYANGLKRLYTYVYTHYRWQSPRCKFSRRAGFRAGSDLYNGSRLSRLCSPLHIHSKPFNFYYKSQKQFRLQSNWLSAYRQNNRSSMRPNYSSQRFLCFAGLSCSASSNRLFRYRDESKIHIFNEQLFTAGFDNCTALQMPLADRNIFQMDKAISVHQNIFWHKPERGQDSNMDCHQRLCFGSNCQEGTEHRAEFGRNAANSQHCTFRESLDYTSTYEKCFAK